MFTGSLDYTVCSTIPKHYNKIYCNLTSPITKYAKLIVTCLTMNCDIVVLNEEDYITINELEENTTYRIGKKIRGDNLETLVTILIKDFFPKIYEISLDECNRFVIKHDHRFTIEDMSYNFKILTGFYNSTFPIESVYDPDFETYSITSESVGMAISTPILYLISNIGMQSYRTGKIGEEESDLYGAKIVMRINNSFCSSAPIIVNNAEFETTILSNDLSSLEFTLVDANLHELELLSPIYLSIHVDAIPDLDISSLIELNSAAS